MSERCNFIIRNQNLDTKAACLEGVADFKTVVTPAIEIKQSIGKVKLASENEVFLGLLTTTLQVAGMVIEDRYNLKVKECSVKNDLRACGFVYSHDKFVEYFGSIGSVQKPSNAPVVLPLKTMRNNYLLVDVPANSEGAEILFDTGASSSALSMEKAKELSPILKRIGSMIGHGIDVFQTHKFKLEFGHLSFAPKYLVVTGFLDFIEGSDINHKFSFLVGTDFLLTTQTEINRDESQIIFNQNVDHRLSNGEWSAIPINLADLDAGYSLAVEIMLNGQPFQLIFDTGAVQTFLTEGCFDKLPNAKIDRNKSALVLHASGINEKLTATDINVEMGNFRFQLPEVTVSPADDPNVIFSEKHNLCGVVGNDILKRFNIMIDPQTFSIFISSSQVGIDSPSFVSLGFTPMRRDGQVIITGVNSGSVAEKVGLRKGDVISKIDGVDISTLSIMQIGGFSHPVKDKLPIIVMRDGEEKEISLPRR